MRLNRIINSLLETDMYKFSMGQAIFHQFTDYRTTWTFRCRNKDVKFTPEMVEEIKDQIRAYCDLRFNEEDSSGSGSRDTMTSPSRRMRSAALPSRRQARGLTLRCMRSRLSPS